MPQISAHSSSEKARPPSGSESTDPARQGMDRAVPWRPQSQPPTAPRPRLKRLHSNLTGRPGWGKPARAEKRAGITYHTKGNPQPGAPAPRQAVPSTPHTPWAVLGSPQRLIFTTVLVALQRAQVLKPKPQFYPSVPMATQPATEPV